MIATIITTINTTITAATAANVPNPKAPAGLPAERVQPYYIIDKVYKCLQHSQLIVFHFII